MVVHVDIVVPFSALYFMIIIIIIITVYFRQKPTEHKKAMNNKTERQTEYRQTETATERHMHTVK